MKAAWLLALLVSAATLRSADAWAEVPSPPTPGTLPVWATGQDANKN